MVATLEDALSIYKYDFLCPKTHEWVRMCYDDDRKRKDVTTIVVASADPDATKAELRASVRKRSPIYLGKHATDLFDERAMRRVFGYGLRDVPPCPVRFVLAAPNYAVGHGRFFTIHAMGINLESEKTVDYAKFVRPDGTLRLRQYQNAVRNMVDAIVRCVDHLGKVGKPHTVRMPAIGCGAYLNAYRGDPAACKASLLKAVTIAARNRPRWTFHICLGDTTGWPASPHKNLIVERCDLFAPPVVDESLFMVNAWDTVSFIGNGGSVDHTIDGMMVAGIGAGKKLINCSFLHNPFFAKRVTYL